MEYFKYIIYFILAHMVLTFVYRGYIHYLYKTNDIQFKRRSAFFSLVRKEIKDNIIAAQENTGAHLDLRRLLVLHNILSVTGKIIMAMIVMLVILLTFSKL
jgi:hypothetical protein